MKSISNITNGSLEGNGSLEATDVLTLRDYLKRTRHVTELYVASRLVHDLGRQIQALISQGRCIAYLGVDDVVVITHRPSDTFTHQSVNDLDSTLGDSRLDPQFLFLNDHLLFEVDESDGALLIDRALKPSSSGTFLSPELVETLKTKGNSNSSSSNSLVRVHFKTAYYSAAQLIIYFLLNVEHTPNDGDEDPEYMDPIKGTSMYWFLLRCLNPEPMKRKYIYI